MSDQPPPVSSTPPPSLPPPVPPVAVPSAPAAVWSLVLGILSFLCAGFITAIPAIICGHIGRCTVRRSGGALGGMGMATAGLILGYVALVLNIIAIPLIVIPLVKHARHEISESSYRSSGKTKSMVSADGNSRLDVPEDWNELGNLNDAAEIQVGNKSKEQYLIVLTENKTDLTDYTLRKHHQTTRAAMLKKMSDSSASEMAELTINGHPAFQDEISGTQENTPIVFLHTTIETDEGYHQILAWTMKSRWNKSKGELAEVTRSFNSEK